ncbi:YiiX/YebB-like N1pC/P60 family cysteine hydrolase [Thermodesulfobacteriota bacterium]
MIRVVRICRILIKIGILNAVILFFQFNATDALGKNVANIDQMAASDSRTIETIRNNFSNIISFMKSRPDLFSEEECNSERMTTQGQRQEIRRTWLNFMDQVMALDSIGKQYTDFYLKLEKPEKKTAFRTAYASFLLQYRYCLEFIGLADRDGCLHTILNESDNMLGIPEGTYSQLKFRFLNVGRGSEFLRLNTIYRYYRPDPENTLTKGINEDIRELVKAGMGKGSLLTLKNALKIVKNAGVTAWFPVQKGVSQWMGDTKVARPHKVLIKENQIEKILPKLEPGDILLERREWYLSNIGLPGFWTHAALFIGTPEMRNQYFKGPEVNEFIEKFGKKCKNLNQLLKARYPASYELSNGIQADGHRPMVIEAISEGVVFTTIQHSFAADSAAVLRPILSKAEKAFAILRAFHYSGRPYDFNFDFLTDSELVCTELVYKSYEGTETTNGLKLPLKSMLGKELISANDIAELFSEEHQSGTQQFNFVCFLDGYEHLGKAVIATKEAFLKSWERPKWHVVLQAVNKEEKME